MARGPLLLSSRAVLAAGLFLATSASGSPPPSLDLRGFQASTDPNASVYLEPASTPGHLFWNLGAWASYSYRLLDIESADGHTVAIPVRNQLSLDYVAGLGLSDRLALGVVLPMVAYQNGDDLSGLVAGAESLPATALGDLALTAKATLLPSGPLGGFAVAALARVALPTGNAASYISESAATGELRLLGELNLVAVTLRATAGMRVRGAEQTFAGTQFGHELPWGGGISVLPQALGIDDGAHWRWNLEAHGALALSPSFAAKTQSPVALALSARYGFGDFGVTAGAELPLADAIGSPRVRALLAFSYAPRVVDTDKDGVPDEKDQCVELAEDRDGFQDDDGCPDFDNDDDGVPDEQDKCPTEKEDTDEFQDDDGCPDPDNDRDGVPDTADKCPNEPGPANGKQPGCPLKDRDVDGISDPDDRCPTRAEDLDAFEDTDGCPEPDNDQDGVSDSEDACPNLAGRARSDHKLNGCPSPDRDNDSLDDSADQCPDQPEDFDGEADLDGCPEPAGAGPIARLEVVGTSRTLILSRPLPFNADGSLDAKSDLVVHAIAALLNQQPDLVLLVGVRPDPRGDAGEQLALNRSFALVDEVRRYTHRDEAAETIGWTAVQKLPGAARNGIGFLVLAAPPAGDNADGTPPPKPAKPTTTLPIPARRSAPTNPTPAPTPVPPPTPASPAKPTPVPAPVAPPTANPHP